MRSCVNPVPVIGLGSVDDNGPHIALIIGGIGIGNGFTGIFVEPLVLATIPRRPLPNGCTHAAIISPLCTMNC